MSSNRLETAQVKKTTKAMSSKEMMLTRVLKRDGSLVPYDRERIIKAVMKAFEETQEGVLEDARFISKKVVRELERITKRFKTFIPSVEGIQDMVEKELIVSDFAKTAKSYILYRAERARERSQQEQVQELDPQVKKLAEESKRYFKNSLGEFVYYRTYAKWIEQESRRETWVETVDRYMAFMRKKIADKLSEKEYSEIRLAILKQEVMPSMRLMQFSGKAAETTNVCAYNCSFIAPESFQDFAEVMYISMCGTGVGFAVETKNIQKLPIIEKQKNQKTSKFVIPDSKEGWCDSLAHGMKAWADGYDVEFDYSELRPAGARLKTMGGKSSGPEPLRQLLTFTRDKMLGRQGKRLRNIDAHDILCMIGNCVVSGGVRRSAMISLSELDDDLVRDAKKGEFWNTNPHRSLSNNSAVYESKPTTEEFLDEWLSLIKSQSGERGIFNRGSLEYQLPERRLKQFNGNYPQWGTNPCGEIILQSKQFCNLTEIIAREEDTEATLLKKIKIATILGTYQSMLTNFPYLSKQWKKNCEQERLLGVSITGQWDNYEVQKPEVLQSLRSEALKVNKKYAERFGVSQSTAITCVKPSGTVSQMVDAASGTHPRHSRYYIRRIRIAATDSLFKMLKEQGVPYHPEVGQSDGTATTYVLEFPVKAPNSAKVFKDDVTAIEQLEHWKNVKVNFTEHNPSTTISVGSDEWIEVGNWVYKNWDVVGGLSFLPRSEFVYQLAPYEVIDKNKYEELMKKYEHIDFSRILSYEKKDETDVKKELACVGSNCEV
jgi:ribonucleoside-triphosphate reductase